MSVAITRAPSAANASAVARPIPCPAAVTSARLPFSLLLMVIPFDVRLAYSVVAPRRRTEMPMTTITAIEAIDVRYPTSRMLDGSDAMNPDPDYSAAYAIVRTSVAGLDGHGMTFTIGRGNELCVAAIDALAPLIVGRTLEELTDDMGALSRRLLGESQMR